MIRKRYIVTVTNAQDQRVVAETDFDANFDAAYAFWKVTLERLESEYGKRFAVNMLTCA